MTMKLYIDAILTLIGRVVYLRFIKPIYYNYYLNTDEPEMVKTSFSRCPSDDEKADDMQPQTRR
jgi:hypothetical protein